MICYYLRIQLLVIGLDQMLFGDLDKVSWGVGIGNEVAFGFERTVVYLSDKLDGVWCGGCDGV